MMLSVLSFLAWAFVVWSASNMDQPLVKLMMPVMASWSLAEAFWVWVMWAVMMGAMMLPSASPMIQAYRRISSQKGIPRESFWFTLAYLLVWTGFCAVATALQWALQSMGVLSHMLVLGNTWFAGGILVVAGIVQWTPFKHACLEKCRTPIGFLVTEWRPGRRGALIMGMRHGAYCIGCCWAVMALLFVFGVMNLVAILLLATFVAAEKLLPGGEFIGNLAGVVFIGWGGWLLLT